ncbi:tRNA (adenosine(37)-N6)-dimethylallyltransferase MiaA [Pelagibacteraceae bacterium]|nr:tRNA (adenosine(37)-N6)-dimethylallyltransferase MiaA [Pelagibacteraceae bacterium]
MSRDLIVIFGPTASGKSKKAIDIALNHKSSIINLDSMQVYKDLRILTDRPTDADLSKCDHRLYGYLNGDESSTAASWLDHAVNEIKECFSNQKLPILVGGTGMYLNALKFGLADIPDIDEATKNETQDLFNRHGLSFLFDEIKKSYPSTKIQENDRQRIFRSHSLLKQTGKVLEQWQLNTSPAIDGVNYHILITTTERDELYLKAELRVDHMFKGLVVDEVSDLLSKGYDDNKSIMKAIGVREIRSFLDKKIDLEECKNIIKKNTRNYIKRQLTWIKGNNITQNIDIKKFI